MACSSHVAYTLTGCERRYRAVEKEATAIIEAVHHWSCFLKCRRFTLVTDEEAASFRFEQSNRRKIENAKILGWRLELSHMTYDIRHKPGSKNVAADSLSRACVLSSLTSLQNLQCSLLVTLVMRDFVTLCSSVIYLILVKRRGKFVATLNACRGGNLFLHAVLIDTRTSCTSLESPKRRFKEPVSGARPYLLIAIDEYSRFPICLSV